MASDSVKTFLKKDDSRSFLNKEFNSFRSDLLLYSQTFFGDQIKDFSEGSMGGLLLEMAAYIGDVMSFYLDHQFNELNIETAVEMKNVEKLVRSAGVTIKGASPSTVEVDFYIEVSDDGTGEPVTSNLPIIREGTTLISTTGVIFTLMDDLDYSETSDSTYLWKLGDEAYGSYSTSSSTGNIVIVLRGSCRSGKVISESFTIPNTFVPFRTIRLSARDVSEILDVRDGVGNIYYEVGSLTQNVVYKKVINISSDAGDVPHNLELIPAPFRFVTGTSATSRMSTLRFGSGQADTLDDDMIPDPSELALPLYQKKTMDRFSIDPNNLLRTRTLGISPQNTVMTVKYRAGGGMSHNVSSQSIRTLGTLLTSFNSSITAASVARIRSSVEVINEEAAAGGEAAPTIPELRSITLAAKNSQSRIVTREDLIARVYTMPSSFGRVYRLGIAENENSPLATLLYIISRNKSGQLKISSNTLKENIRLYLNENRLVADSIDICDAFVINLSVTYNIVCDEVSNPTLVIQAANNSLSKYMKIENFQIDQPLVKTDLQNIIINTDGVVSLVNFEISNETGTSTTTGNIYSEEIFDVDFNTVREIIYPPTGGIFEIKYPSDDIIGSSI